MPDKKYLEGLSASFEADATLQQIKALRRISREKTCPPGKRKLDPFRNQIIYLRQAGASERDIQTWLRYACRCVVSKTTVHNYIQLIQAHDKQTPSRLTRPTKKSSTTHSSRETSDSLDQ